jgi:predicted Zn-dependent protease
VLLQRDEIPHAIALLQQAIEDYPESSWARLLLGRAWLRAGNLVASEQVLRSALQREPDSVEGHF